MSKSLGEVCSTYEKYNIEYVLGVLIRRQLEVVFRLPIMSKTLGEVCSTYENYNIEYVLGVLSRRQLEADF